MRAPRRILTPLIGLTSLLVWGCGGGPDAGPSRADDLRRYADLAASDDPRDCAVIGDLSLRGECWSMAASTLAAEGEVEAAEAACAEMDAGFWQGECWFLVTDAAQTRGKDVARRCGKAGRLRNQCLIHAFDRETAETRRELEGQGAAALEEALTERFAAFVPGVRAEKAAHVLVAGGIAEQDAGQPFRRELCGDALEATCRDAFVLRVESGVMRGLCLGRPDPSCAPRALEAVCAEEPRQSETAASQRLPTWKPDVDPLVQQAWTRLCDPTQRPLSQGAPGAGP